MFVFFILCMTVTWRGMEVCKASQSPGFLWFPLGWLWEGDLRRAPPSKNVNLLQDMFGLIFVDYVMENHDFHKILTGNKLLTRPHGIWVVWHSRGAGLLDSYECGWCCGRLEGCISLMSIHPGEWWANIWKCRIQEISLWMILPWYNARFPFCCYLSKWPGSEIPRIENKWSVGFVSTFPLKQN